MKALFFVYAFYIMKEKVKSSIVLDIENKIIDILNTEKIELIDTVVFLGKNKHITIFIFNKNGITLEKIGKISKQLNPIIESIPCFKDGFTLEVSSPGIFRKIKSYKEFNIFSGREIKIVTLEGEVLIGSSNGLEGNNLLLKMNENKKIKIDINNIKSANLNG